MTSRALKAIRAQLGWSQARLAAAVGIATGSIARQERGELGISEPVARLVRLIAAGVDVEAVINTGSSRRAGPFKPAKSSKPGHSKSKGRGRAR